ncbi:hypothetical protein PGT21_021023 [Puccinia graminis f. sp. tritici]|uniref:Secreted protein n=1 Tax=Puccinia graminis f. sp. tritici TaxID=56615 RepID=A0A5B0PSD8_PUCGR|nr:hypothetical protein PGT21_021023 [Puccinia graminis f. sp. tritici]
MSMGNDWQRGSLGFVLVTLIITLYLGQVAAGTTQHCGYHFSPTSSKGKGASCMQNDKDDKLCVLDSCTSDASGLKWDLVRYNYCRHGQRITPEAVKPAQYFRRKDYVEVQKDGSDKWVHCAYSSPTNYQMTCSDCSS